MKFSVKIALVALLTGGTLTDAHPGNSPPLYPSKYNPPPPPPVYQSRSTTCHMAFVTSTHVFSKPHTTVVLKTETKTVPFTKEVAKTSVVLVTYTTKTLHTSFSTKTVAIPYTREKHSTKVVEKAYQCPATTFSLKRHTSTSIHKSTFKTKKPVIKTHEETKTHLVSGHRTKTEESVRTTWVPFTTHTASPCTDKTTEKRTYTSDKLTTKTFTSIWTEVHTIPEVHTRTITTDHVHTTTKAVVTSKPTRITKHFTKRVPFTHTSLITKTVTHTTLEPSIGTKTITKTHVSTVRVPHVYTSTCHSHSKHVITYPVTHTTHKVKTIPVTEHVPCTRTSKSTKITHVPKVFTTTSVFQTRCTETPFETFTQTTVKSHEVCTTAPAQYGSPNKANHA